MSRTLSPVSGKPYGLALVCRMWRVPRATVYRHRISHARQPRVHTARLASAPHCPGRQPVHGEGRRKVWARLRVAGIRTSRRRVLRLWGTDLTTTITGEGHAPSKPSSNCARRCSNSARPTTPLPRRRTPNWAAILVL